MCRRRLKLTPYHRAKIDPLWSGPPLDVMELEPWLHAGQGVWRVIDVEDWAEIRRLHRAEGMGIKAVARRRGMARNTVRDALRSGEPPRYQRVGAGSAVDAVEPEIRRLLGEFPEMPATVIAERIGWERGITVLRDRVAAIAAPVDTIVASPTARLPAWPSGTGA